VELLLSLLAARLALMTPANFACRLARLAAGDDARDVGDPHGAVPLAVPVVTRLTAITLATPRTTTRPITDRMAVHAL
jgi:hypothetical protein